VQKAVELGAYEVIPVSMKRCIMKLDAKKATAKQKRWQAIAESAAKQSKRLIIPQVHEVLSYSAALEHAMNWDKKILPYENERGMAATRDFVRECGAGMDIAVFIGPEGGFDEAEVEQAKKLGWQPVSLGNRILRTETAGLTMLSILMYQLEE
jgi:16S rRNA (uracil1498-N3)-methyltransferase